MDNMDHYKMHMISVNCHFVLVGNIDTGLLSLFRLYVVMTINTVALKIRNVTFRKEDVSKGIAMWTGSQKLKQYQHKYSCQ